MNLRFSPARLSVTHSAAFAVATLLIGSCLAPAVQAQSGTRVQPVRPSAPAPSYQSGSGTRAATPAPTSQPGSGTRTVTSPLALQGYCPVCIVDMKQWVKGNGQFAAQYDGKTYLFPGEDQKQMFVSNPSKFTPILGGDCIVALVESGRRVPGSLQFAALHEGHVYLFANDQAKGMFLANKERYAQADVALGGKCTVCRVEMNKDVDGVAEFTSFHNGMRYLFPGQEQQQMFDRNPGKYEMVK